MKRVFKDGLLLHHQVRIGRGGKPLVVTKFRTMRAGAHSKHGEVFSRGHPVVVRPAIEDGRISGGWARLLRRTHLDEIPQFTLVLSGKLHFVGMRPVNRKEYRSLPDDVRKMYDEIGPGWWGIPYGARKMPKTEEELFSMYRKFCADWKKEPLSASLKWGARIFLNKISGRSPTK